MQDTVESLDKKISGVSADIKRLEKKVSGWAARRDELLIERNTPNFCDIEWLINNPNTPGQYKAMNKWMGGRFGGEFMGVISSGYYPATNQQAFSIMIHDRYDTGAKDIEKKVANVKAFMAECLHMMKPKDDGFVSFTYASGQYSGIFDLSYEPSSGKWWTTNTRYNRMIGKEPHADLDAAIVAAQKIAEGVED